MSQGRQPTTHAERTQIIAAMDAYAARANPNPVALELIERYLRAGLETYRAARADFVRKEAQAIAAREAADEADVVFDRAARTLAASLGDEAGRRTPEILRPLLNGHLLSEVIRMPYPEEVRILSEFFTQLPLRTDLELSERRVEALRQAHETLRVRTEFMTSAEADVRAAGRVQSDAMSSFRTAWGDFLRFALRQLDPTTQALLLPAYARETSAARSSVPAADSAAGEGDPPDPEDTSDPSGGAPST